MKAKEAARDAAKEPTKSVRDAAAKNPYKPRHSARFPRPDPPAILRDRP